MWSSGFTPKGSRSAELWVMGLLNSVPEQPLNDKDTHFPNIRC